jgi:hypothetical protein
MEEWPSLLPKWLLADVDSELSVEVDIGTTGPIPTDKKLFSETGGFIVEVGDGAAFAKLAGEMKIFPIGTVTESSKFIVKENGTTVLESDRAKLLNAWLNGLRNLLNT